MRFEIKLASEIIGHSNLEQGDPSMGCAGGRFVPTAAYKETIEEYCISHWDCWEGVEGLSVNPVSGGLIECVGGIQIMDPGPQFSHLGIEIHICGIPHPLYAELFPEHAANR